MSRSAYTFDDVGCYVDGARGSHATDVIVEFARDLGAQIDHDCDDDHGLAHCEFQAEIEDEATEWMNDNHPVEGASWGRNENGDWGLWEDES